MAQRERDVGAIGGLMKGAGFVFGLATELHAHNKAKKSSKQSFKHEEPQSDTKQDPLYLGIPNNPPPTYEKAISSSTSLDSEPLVGDESRKLFDNFTTVSPLPYPVILPQRRPNDKTRGFVRAYAPDLGTYKGIEETTFLNFLKQFHKSSQASGWFHVVNLAAFGAGFAPSAIATAVATSVQMLSTVGAEAQRRYRTNAYLDKANKELFHPRNLHCMIMTFKPEANQNDVLDFDVNGGFSAPAPTVSSRSRSGFGNTNRSSGTGGNMFRTSDGVTEGELAIPAAAYLVYSTSTPGEGSLNVDEDGLTHEKKESSWKSTGKFLADYRDRRAQAKFAATHGDDSKIAVPGALDPNRFASKFSDPNGNPFAFMQRRDDHRDESRDRRRERSGDRRSREQSRDTESRTGLLGGMKKMMQQDVLYLLIAEMPSEEEMRNLLH